MNGSTDVVPNSSRCGLPKAAKPPNYACARCRPLIMRSSCAWCRHGKRHCKRWRALALLAVARTPFEIAPQLDGRRFTCQRVPGCTLFEIEGHQVVSNTLLSWLYLVLWCDMSSHGVALARPCLLVPRSPTMLGWSCLPISCCPCSGGSCIQRSGLPSAPALVFRDERIQ